jgi:hypothetical protein
MISPDDRHCRLIRLPLNRLLQAEDEEIPRSRDGAVAIDALL